MDVKMFFSRGWSDMTFFVRSQLILAGLDVLAGRWNVFMNIWYSLDNK